MEGRYVFDFTEGGMEQLDLLGGKGANLAEMTCLVPRSLRSASSSRRDGARAPNCTWGSVASTAVIQSPSTSSITSASTTCRARPSGSLSHGSRRVGPP